MKKKLIAALIAVAMSASTVSAEVATLKKPIGTYEITAYSYHEGGGENYETASGRTPVPYYTVACDPNVIPPGTVLYIEGIGKVRADDTGSAVKGKVLDLHVGYDATEDFGRKKRKVWIIR